MTFGRHTSNQNPGEKDAQRTALRGQVLVMFAAALMLLLGMVALAVDAGFLMAERRQAQSSADAGALAAARAKLDYLNLASIEQEQVSAGKQYGAANANVPEANVEVDTDPPNYDDEYVQVTVTKDVESFFLRAIYNGTWSVNATAVAGIIPLQRPYALLALDCGPGGQDGIYINGSGQIDVNEGSIMSNCGIDRSGDSSRVLAGGVIDAHGGINAGPLWHAEEGYNPNRAPVPDPVVQLGIEPPTKAMATSQVNGVEVPAADSITDAITNLTNVSSTSARCPNGATCVMRPGYYGTSGASNFTLDLRSTLVMEQGIYYFGGNFRIDGGSTNARIEGEDVLLYFTDNARFIPGNAKMELATAEESLYPGGLDGMLLWIANCTPFMMQANGTFDMEGVIYAPCSQVRLYGSPGTKSVQAVVGNLELAGSSAFDIVFKEFISAEMPQVFLVQ